MLLQILLSLLFFLIRVWLQQLVFPQHLLNLFVVQPVSASSQPPPLPSHSKLIFADDFELGLGRWQLVRGQPSHWQINFLNQLEASIPSPSTVSEMTPLDLFWQGEQCNYRLEFEVRAMTDADVNWVWGFEDINNWYELHFYGDHVHLVRLRNNQVVLHHTQDFTLERNKTHKVVIIFDQGLVQTWVGNEMIINHQDPTYENNTGKISFKATTGAAYPTFVWFNKLRVYSLDLEPEQFLPMTAFKQYQQPWRDDEYNHALEWHRWGDWRRLNPEQPPTQVTMYHWGCAVSSLAMVMRYHGLESLPSGEDLDPGSLNQWLRREADGYVGQGSLNWLAGTRLSRLISQANPNSVPKLEYHRHYSNLKPYLQSMIDQGRPGILQIPGHFLVGQGYLQQDEQQLDFYISDPAYSHTVFSQHDQPMVSLVDLQPTHTDQSYIMILHSIDVQLELVDAVTLQPIEGLLFQDTVANPFYEFDGCLELEDQDANYPYECAHHQSAMVTTYFSQPDSGEYLLDVINSSQDLQRLEIFLYDQQAAVMMIDRFLKFDLHQDSNEQLELSFNKEQLFESYVVGESQPDFAGFFDQLETLYLEGKVSGKLFLALQPFAEYTQSELTEVTTDRYKQLIMRYLFELEPPLENDVLKQMTAHLE